MVESVNHVTTGLGQLISQYAEDRRLRAFLYSFLEQAQELEQVFQDIDSTQDLEATEDRLLAPLAELFGLPKGDMTTEEHSLALQFSRFFSGSNGTMEQTVDAWLTFYPDLVDTDFLPYVQRDQQGEVVYVPFPGIGTDAGNQAIAAEMERNSTDGYKFSMAMDVPGTVFTYTTSGYMADASGTLSNPDLPFWGLNV